MKIFSLNIFHASPKGVKRMEALNKFAKNLSGKDFHASREAVSVKEDTNNNRLALLFWRLAKGKKPKHKKRNSRVLDCIFRLDWPIFSSFYAHHP